MGTGSFVHGHFPLNLRSCSCGLFVMHVSSGMIGYSSLIMSLASHDMIQTRLWNLFETFSFSGCSNVHLSNMSTTCWFNDNNFSLELIMCLELYKIWLNVMSKCTVYWFGKTWKLLSMFRETTPPMENPLRSVWTQFFFTQLLIHISTA